MRDEDVAAALRELIAAVIITPAEAKDDPGTKLAQLTGAPELFLQQHPPTVVAGAGLEPATSGL